MFRRAPSDCNGQRNYVSWISRVDGSAASIKMGEKGEKKEKEKGKLFALHVPRILHGAGQRSFRVNISPAISVA